jgi:hypothetical protein
MGSILKKEVGNSLSCLSELSIFLLSGVIVDLLLREWLTADPPVNPNLFAIQLPALPTSSTLSFTTGHHIGVH